MKPSATLVTTLSTLLLWACMPGFTRCSDTPLALAPANNHAACSLNIDRVVVGDCEYGARTGFRSKIIVAVFLSWSMPVPGEKIQLSLNGQIKLFDPFMKGCPPFVQFILDPDGASYPVEAEFVSGSCIALPQTIQLPSPCDPPACLGPRAIGGKVFTDYNGNGIQESSENGLPGIEVRLYDDAKQRVAVTFTKTNGFWAVDSLTAGQKLRAEFQVPAGLFDANPGTDNKTRTQIAAVGNCKVDLGIYLIRSLIDQNPWIVTTCFAKGDALDPASPAFNEPTLVANLYSTSAGGPRTGPDGNYYVASAGETGSVWGLAYQKETRQLFSGAFLKRNASLGPGGFGAIYVTDLNGLLPTPPPTPGYRYYGRTGVLLNLDSFGIQTGDETTLLRNLPSNPFAASHDSAAFDKIGKWGLGDLDLNDAGDTLYAVNLHNRSLLVIAIGNPLQLPVTANRIQEIPIPDPGCTSFDDWRPWGLKYKDGKVYVGGVCSAESTGNSDDLKGVVYAFENGGFLPVVSFDLNYTKGFLEGNYCSVFRAWNPNFYSYYIFADRVCGPVPVLSDIEFDSEDNMVVSVGDRYGYQSGGQDYGTNPRDGQLYISFSGGDNLKLFKLKNEFLLEQNGTSGFYTTQGAGNKQGVCGGEFYFQDGFFSHQESSLGALAAHPSYNTIVATLMDPSNIWSNGWSQLDNSLGTKNVNYNIFTGQRGTFGKSAGLGDIELLIGSSTPKGIGVSIGNYVWTDRDQDGVQDPGEIPIPGVPVLLYNQNDSLIKQTVSDTNGFYYFRELEPFTEYYIQIGTDSHYIGSEFILDSIGYATTNFQSRINFGNSENDSDASQTLPLPPFYKGKIALDYLTGKDGENNFSLDFGLLPCDQIVPDTLRFGLCSSDSIQIGETWFSKSNPAGMVRLPNAKGFGCDSLILVEASIYSESSGRLDTSVCAGGNIRLHNQTFDAANPNGRIVLLAGNQHGCDSLIDVSLSFLPHSNFNYTRSICPGDQITLHNQTFDSTRRSGQILLAGANQFGCDSLINVSISLLPISQSVIHPSICPGEQLVLHNQVFDTARTIGQIVLTGANQFGCDSLIHVELNILPATQIQIDTAICPGAQISIHNQIFDENKRTGSIVLPGANQFGCDSVLWVQLRMLPASESRIDTSVCLGGSVLIHQQLFNEQNPSGKIVLPATNGFGCDSTILVDLRFRPEYNFRDTVSGCVEYTWPVTGKTYRSSGSYRLDALTRENCDSTHQLQLTIHPEYQFYDTICALDRFTWPANGQVYDQDGVYEFNHRSSFGCDSIAFLVLLIAHAGEVYVPNVFSPNGDGINDRLSVFANEDVRQIDVFAVYNRWGELVFELRNFPPNDPQLGWDGIFRSQPANPAVFVYRVEWRDKFGGMHKSKGDATLVR